MSDLKVYKIAIDCRLKRLNRKLESDDFVTEYISIRLLLIGTDPER